MTANVETVRDSTTDSDHIRNEVREVARRAREAAGVLATLTRASKDAALLAIADALEAATAEIVEVNADDVERARAAGTSEALVDRLTLTADRIAAIADALREVAVLDDPVGDVVRGYRLPNGLDVAQVRVPLGVVAMIYEARPNVTVDAAGLCLKSGNAALLRGSSSARRTNRVLVDLMRAALVGTDVPVDAIAMVPGDTHDSVVHLMQARGLVDVIIPRGGAGLINSVVENSQVPVIETGVGNCHVYVDADVDVDQAVAVVVNSKTQRVSVCNAAETMLVHADAAEDFLPDALAALAAAGVTIHGDERVRPFAERAGAPFVPVTDDDWAEEYYSLDLAVGIVDDLDAAVAHIRRWSSGHTEAILSTSAPAIRRFTTAVDSAAVMVNASTRFTDGGEFGFGAEIGISTQKLHARGPMGLAELTSTTFVVTGDGHTRG
ncbi:MAG: glutamate-5-semialdehyde dehydrogenase [Actinobacteria bacterium]|nr:glutamate-5-semialdehyde dehydrogenase [Actinomycetota bacterium]